jgi:hypothetical protein
MKYLFAFTIVLILANFGHADDPAKKIAEQKGWFASFTKAKAEAERTRKPLWIVIRCGP